MSLTWNKASQEDANKNFKRLEALIKRPDNIICADCPIKGPRWASLNLGIFVCMPCAGIHRNLGVHISKMKSVNLDKWNADWVDNMEAWGNVRANQVWEARLPAHYDGKPNEREAADQAPKLERFIRDKYERALWKLDDNAPLPPMYAGAATAPPRGSAPQQRQQQQQQQQQPAPRAPAPAAPKPPVVDLMGDFDIPSSQPQQAAPQSGGPADLLSAFDGGGFNQPSQQQQQQQPQQQGWSAQGWDQPQSQQQQQQGANNGAFDAFGMSQQPQQPPQQDKKNNVLAMFNQGGMGGGGMGGMGAQMGGGMGPMGGMGGGGMGGMDGGGMGGMGGGGMSQGMGGMGGMPPNQGMMQGGFNQMQGGQMGMGQMGQGGFGNMGNNMGGMGGFR